MKMKNFLLGLSLICLSAGAQNGQKSEDFAEPALKSTVVAIEYTGQWCMYCPEMSRTLQESQDKFGRDKYIIVALHSLESYSNMHFLDVKLYNEEAKIYSDAMEANSGLPQVYYNSLGKEVDGTELKDMYKQPDLLDISGKVSVNDDGTYNVKFNTMLRSDRKEFIKGKQIAVLIMALENNIDALQYKGKWSVVKHNHIFRGSLNTTWGKPYEIGTEYENNLPVPESVLNVNNTEVVVLFLDHETKKILDATTFAVPGGEQTGIENVTAEAGDAAIYNLQGIKVNSTVRGYAYIRNGRKFIAE